MADAIPRRASSSSSHANAFALACTCCGDVAPNSTVVGIPGRVIHQSGVRIDPLAHSALPDAEARVIRNLMERIDILEGEITRLQSCLREVAEGRPLQEPCTGRSQNLRDREILEFLGDSAP